MALNTTSALISAARRAAVVSVVKKGLPQPAPNTTTRPFSRYAFYRWNNLAQKPNIFLLAMRGAVGGFVAVFSFGSIMLATRLDKVGEAAVLRETSTVFAAIIGWLFLKETVGPRRVY